jgi:hypothetical protein
MFNLSTNTCGNGPQFCLKQQVCSGTSGACAAAHVQAAGTSCISGADSIPCTADTCDGVTGNCNHVVDISLCKCTECPPCITPILCPLAKKRHPTLRSEAEERTTSNALNDGCSYQVGNFFFTDYVQLAAAGCNCNH